MTEDGTGWKAMLAVGDVDAEDIEEVAALPDVRRDGVRLALNAASPCAVDTPLAL